ncbi:MAG: hypothetical protein SW833_08450 [Cyanobacteriota bacterium]|nr:hypothetical protein [Cyanobacteriota bacterium]
MPRALLNYDPFNRASLPVLPKVRSLKLPKFLNKIERRSLYSNPTKGDGTSEQLESQVQ